MFIKSKRGLSEVVTTVIIIVLVLAAIAIVWSVINGLISGGLDDINVNSKCLNLGVDATAVTNTSLIYYNVVLTRNSGNDATISGVKLVLSNTTTSSVIDVPGNIAQLGSTTKNATGPINANKVEATVYFTDDSGNEQICPSASKFEF